MINLERSQILRQGWASFSQLFIFHKDLVSGVPRTRHFLWNDHYFLHVQFIHQACTNVCAAVSWISCYCRVNVAWMSREWFHCSNATFKLSLHLPTVVNSNFWCATRILRQAEFQICITLPHQWASETCRNRNSFIPTFSGHWSPDPSPRSGSWEPD